jgi:hypothetical protein
LAFTSCEWATATRFASEGLVSLLPTIAQNNSPNHNGRRGNKSVPPEDPNTLVVILRMALLFFLDDINSERELIRIIPERPDYLWLLGC